MKRLFSFAFACFAVVCLVTSARGAITTGDLVGGTQNELEDDDFDLLVNAGGSIKSPGAGTVVDVGDFLFGIFRINAVRVPAGGPQVASATDTEATFTGYLALKVLAKGPAGTSGIGGAPDAVNDVVYTIGAPSLAEWATLLDQPADATLSSYVPVNPGTMLVVHQDPDNIDQTLATADAALKTVTGPKLWEIGIDLSNPTNFWTVQTDTDDLATSFAFATGSFSANLDLLGTFSGPPLVPQVVVGGFADVLLRNGSFGSGAPGAPAFGVSSDVDALILPVPEPASILAWAGVMSVGLCFGTRMRKRRV